MKKRILISILTLLFLISTTGLPVTYHLCQMIEDMSAEECGMCSSTIELVGASCCSGETMEYPVTLSSENPLCCQDEFIYNKVESDFLNSKTEITFYSKLLSLESIVSIIHNQVELSITESYYTDSSPPFLIDPEIHITNASLLI